MFTDSAAYRQLLLRYLDNDLDIVEIHALFDFIMHEPAQADLLLSDEDGKRFQKKWAAEPLLSEQQKTRMFNALMLDIHMVDERDRVRWTALFKRYKWWSAAAALVLLVAGIWLYQTLNKTPAPAISAVKEDSLEMNRPPGGIGAVLTLTNGKTILLDSSRNGRLTEEGSTDVVKTDNGLVYDPQAKTVEMLYNTLTTRRGEMFPLVLSDGTKVWLNAASSIHFPVAFNPKERVVEISGEVYFEVARNETAPFIVKKTSDNFQVQVLGTRFNVNAYDDEDAVKITLLEGSVKVKDEDVSGILRPGQQAQLNNGLISINDKVNLDEVMAWKNGMFIFNKTDIIALFRQLSRWYNVELVIKGIVPDKKFVGGIYRNSSLSQVLEILRENNLVTKIEGRKIIVSSK
jgi:transmembrane sensor